MAVQLDAESLAEVRKILAFHAPAVKLWAFGSRAMGTARRFSDLDLALEGEGLLEHRLLSRLRHAFVESDMPIKLDVVDWNALDPEFREVIDKQKVPI